MQSFRAESWRVLEDFYKSGKHTTSRDHPVKAALRGQTGDSYQYRDSGDCGQR